MQLHESVLLQESIDALNIHPHGIYIDATFGCGGHTQQIINKLSSQGKLLVIDKDKTAIERAQQQLHQYDNAFVHHGSFANLDNFLAEHNLKQINGILFDLGISSPQLEVASRGFSFQQDGPLDMRMNQRSGQSAAQLLQNISEYNLQQILRDYGEEQHNIRIARAIVNYSKNKQITSTLELAQIVKDAHPRWPKRIHPATKTFQALRIAVNSELDDLNKALNICLNKLTSTGRLCVISFHSLEARITKNFIRHHATARDSDPMNVTNTHYIMPTLRKIAKIKPSAEEIEQNIRARSALLWVAEKI